MQKSMTSGSPFRLILAFALPLLLGNLFQQAYNMADAAIVGQTLGANALAAVGATGSVQFLVLGFCLGTSSGFAIPIANSFGAERYGEMRRYTFNGAVLMGMIALAVAIVTGLSCHWIIELMQTPAEIATQTYYYLLIIFLGIPFTLLYNYLSAVLRALGDSRTPFLFLAFSSVLNILLDFFCILVLKWGVPGAAIATIFSQAVSGILCLLLIIRKVDILHFTKEDRVMDKNIVVRLLNNGIPMGLQFSITAIGSMVMQSANNSLGTVYVSAIAAGNRINNLFMCPFDSLATAVCTFISQNYGALKEDRMKAGVKIGLGTAFVYSIIAAVCLIFLGQKIALIFLSAENVLELEAAGTYLLHCGLFYPALGFLCVIRLIVQGVGWSKRAVVAGAFEMVARIVVTMFVGTYGFRAICYCDPAAWIAADIYLIPIGYLAVKEAMNKVREAKREEAAA